jgi:hypothetical protein
MHAPFLLMPTSSDSPEAALPPRGKHLFNQDQVWVDISGVPHALHMMTTIYRANVIAHLLREARHFWQEQHDDQLVEELVAFSLGEPPPEALTLPADPVEWVTSTPLMRRLQAMTPNWEQHVTEDRDELTDQDDGAWILHTDNSRQLIDLDTRTATRLPLTPGAPSDLRRDGQAVTLIKLVHCRRGESAAFVLDLRADGVVTLRSTSVVRWITRAGLT